MKLAGIFSKRQSSLSPDLFDSESKLKTAARIAIMEKAFSFLSPQIVYRMWIMGSMLGYQYTAKSDIDIQIQIIDSEKVNAYSILAKEFNNSEERFFGNHPVSFFILPKFETVDYENLTGAYDLLNDKWVKRSVSPPEGFEQRTQELNKPYLDLLVREFGRQLGQVTKRPVLHEAKDVYNLYEKIDKLRKLYYEQGTGIPKFSRGNIDYKAVEREFGHLPEKIHHLFRSLN